MFRNVQCLKESSKMWTLTTFAYEIDRSHMDKRLQRPFSSIVARLLAILSHLDKTDCIVRVYCDDHDLYDRLVRDFPRVETVLRPVQTWPAYSFEAEMKRIVHNKVNGKNPEHISSDYSLIVLSKLDALLETAQIYPDATHMWLDAGYRWDISKLDKPYWPSLAHIYVPVKHFPFKFKNKYFGGCWGGSSRALLSLRKAYDELLPVLLQEGQPFTEETLMYRIHTQYPELFYNVNLHSTGPIPIGNLAEMIPFMVAGGEHSKMRKALSPYDMVLIVLAILCFVYLRPKLLH